VSAIDGIRELYHLVRPAGGSDGDVASGRVGVKTFERGLFFRRFRAPAFAGATCSGGGSEGAVEAPLYL
jgi:hypothetical protein